MIHRARNARDIYTSAFPGAAKAVTCKKLRVERNLGTSREEKEAYP